MKGSVGDWTFSRHDGKTVASQKVERKSTPTRKKSQMRLRTQLSNLVNLFRAFGQTLHPSFEKRKSGASDFNEFVRANLGAVPVYLTKSEAKQGGSVVAGYLVTLGTLPSINVTMGAGDVATTDISLGSMSITASTTLKAFSNAVVNNNRDYEYGDQISAFIATQTVNSESHVPYVKIEAVEVTLNENDEETVLRDIVGPEAFSVVDGKLAAGAMVNGAITWVHSRKTKNGTQVSTQHFVTSNSILPNYQSAAQMNAAIDSYGGADSEEFLTPNVDDVVAPELP